MHPFISNVHYVHISNVMDNAPAPALVPTLATHIASQMQSVMQCRCKMCAPNT